MKVSDTPSGKILDWMVAKALGFRPAKRERRNWGYELVLDETAIYSRQMIGPQGNSLRLSAFCPSHEGIHAMSIAERHRIGVMPASDDALSGAYAFTSHGVKVFGRTYCESICRCLVIDRLGEHIEVPPELVSS